MRRHEIYLSDGSDSSLAWGSHSMSHMPTLCTTSGICIARKHMAQIFPRPYIVPALPTNSFTACSTRATFAPNSKRSTPLGPAQHEGNLCYLEHNNCDSKSKLHAPRIASPRQGEGATAHLTVAGPTGPLQHDVRHGTLTSPMRTIKPTLPERQRMMPHTELE